MTFTTGGKTMRFIEHTPKRWAGHLRKQRPIIESIVPLRANGAKNWNAMSAGWIVDFARWVVNEDGVQSRSNLEIVDRGLCTALRKRKLIGRVRFQADERAWRLYSDDELVDYAQKFVDENGIESRKGLDNADSGLYTTLLNRKLIGRVKFETGRRAWSKYSDDELVDYAQKFVDGRCVESRGGLGKEDNGLYIVLLKRKLVDRLKFTADKRAWRLYSDDELVDYAQKFVDENGIESRIDIKNADLSLYSGLLRRKLMGRLKFRADERAWRLNSDDELVDYAQKFVDENGIESRKKFVKADGGLHNALVRRKLLDRVKFKADERRWSRYSDESLVAYAQKFVDENGIENRSGLQKNCSGLYQALMKRKLLDQVFCEVERDKECKGLHEISEAMGEFKEE